MDAQDAAFFDYRQATLALGELTEPAQIRRLKFELLDALARLHDLRDRYTALQAQLAALQAQAGAEDPADDAFARHLHAEWVRARSELALAQGAHDRELRALRDELRASERERRALDLLCRSLLATLEQAVENDFHTPGEPDAAAEPQVSAS